MGDIKLPFDLPVQPSRKYRTYLVLYNLKEFQSLQKVAFWKFRPFEKRLFYFWTPKFCITVSFAKCQLRRHKWQRLDIRSIKEHIKLSAIFHLRPKEHCYVFEKTENGFCWYFLFPFILFLIFVFNWMLQKVFLLMFCNQKEKLLYNVKEKSYIKYKTVVVLHKTVTYMHYALCLFVASLRCILLIDVDLQRFSLTNRFVLCACVKNLSYLLTVRFAFIHIGSDCE